MQSAVDQGNFIKTVSPAFHEGLREEIEDTIYKHSTKDDLSPELLILNVANGYKEAIIEQYEVLKTVFEQEYKVV